jgi:hypothetical protein
MFPRIQARRESQPWKEGRYAQQEAKKAVVEEDGGRGASEVGAVEGERWTGGEGKGKKEVKKNRPSQIQRRKDENAH